MICAKAGVLSENLRIYASEVAFLSSQAYHHANIVQGIVHLISPEKMALIPSISIDHALLEKMNKLKCVRGYFKWSDVGSFDAFFDQFPMDETGNAISAKDLILVGSKNNLVVGGNRMIALIDMENIAIIDTPDALLVSKLGSTQKVKEVVQMLKTKETAVYKTHLREDRPWGGFTVLSSQDKHKVKKLVVNPGKRLSLQKHQQRSEHWVVVAGSGLITLGKEEITIHKNQSIYIPQGEIHRVFNPRDEDLVIIEVQCGDYTGEDDIVRLEDDFNMLRDLEKQICPLN